MSLEVKNIEYDEDDAQKSSKYNDDINCKDERSTLFAFIHSVDFSKSLKILYDLQKNSKYTYILFSNDIYMFVSKSEVKCFTITPERVSSEDALENICGVYDINKLISILESTYQEYMTYYLYPTSSCDEYPSLIYSN